MIEKIKTFLTSHKQKQTEITQGDYDNQNMSEAEARKEMFNYFNETFPYDKLEKLKTDLEDYQIYLEERFYASQDIKEIQLIPHKKECIQNLLNSYRSTLSIYYKYLNVEQEFMMGCASQPEKFRCSTKAEVDAVINEMMRCFTEIERKFNLVKGDTSNV